VSDPVQQLDEWHSRRLTEAEGYLKAVLEDYESATEELRSTHEALAYANRELQVLNDDLNAANKDLLRLNEELRARNREAEGACNELAGILRSAGVAIVVLGPDLRIRRFTNLAERIFRLRDGDIGRPIHEIPALGLDGLERAGAEVLKTLQARALVAGTAGKPVTLWLGPYCAVDNRVDGIVILALDGIPHA